MALPDVVTVTLNPAIDRTVTVPGFALGAVNRVEEVHDRAGGKGVNVAAALADAGHQVAVSGFLGRDNAAIFEAMFADKGITDAFVRIPGETRVGIKIIDPGTSETTDINFKGAAPGHSAIDALKERLTPLIAPGRWFILGGTLPPGLPDTTWADLVRFLKERQVRVLIDTSGAALPLAIDVIPAALKPNLEELESATGHSLGTEADIVDVARRLIARGIRLIAVSLGASGACFVTADEALVAEPPAIEITSTVGAGDAMVAGMITAELAGQELAEIARLGTAFSLDRLTRLEVGLGSMERIREFAERVVIRSAKT